MATRTYSSKRVAMSFDKVPITGLMKGDFVKITPSADGFTEEVGPDGEVSRSASADESVMVEITVKSDSPINDTLSSKFRVDRRTLQGFGTLNISDTNGTTVLNDGSAWIKKMVEVTLGEVITARTWTFFCPRPEYNAGGNN